jgi:hypothetical protein
MIVGDHVAVFDTHRGRWCSGQILSVWRASAIVVTRSWCAVVPLLPRMVRPIHVVIA